MDDQPSLEDLQRWLARCADLTGADLSETESVQMVTALEELKAGAAAAQDRGRGRARARRIAKAASRMPA